MKQKIKKSVAVFLCFVMLFTILPQITLRSYAATYSGTCGDNLTWSLDTDTGVLTISGTGAMEDYDSTRAPWKDYSSSISKVKVEDGVTSIGKDAFSNCWHITTVSIPSSVNSIGKEAFCEDTYIRWVYITDLLAWCGISFADASANPLYCGANLYINGNLADDISIPNSVSAIGNYTFYGCGSVEHVIIPDGVTTIGESSFFRCRSLTTVTIPNSVTDIGKNAFDSCSQLADVYINDLITWVSINFENSGANPLCYGDNLYINGEIATDIVIPDGVTTIGDYAFTSFSGMKSLTIPDSVACVGEDAFACGGLENVYITDLVAWSSINFKNAEANPFCYGKNLYIDGELTVELSRIPDGVVNIGSYAFANMDNLINLTLPDSVTTIGEGAFYDCEFLKLVNIPNSVTTIANNAFYSCNSLESVDIPHKVTTIGENAFRYCYSLTSVSVWNGVKEIGGSAFFGCSSLESIFIPGSVTTIGEGAFASCSDLTAIEVSAENTAYCSEEGVLFTKPKTLLLSYPAGKTGSSYEIPDGVVNIGECAFDGSNSLTSLTIPSTLENVDMMAFYGCNSLKDVCISDIAAWCNITFGDTRYDGYEFSTPLVYADNLYINGELATDIIIPDGVTKIGALSFWYYSNLKSVHIPNSVTTIGEQAFAGCDGLTSVTIPDSVTTIEALAFYSCSNLIHVHFLGDVPVLKNSLSKNHPPFQMCNEDMVLCYIEGTQGWDEDSYIAWRYNCALWNYGTESSCVGLTYTCKDCGEIYNAVDTSAALGHEWGEGVVTTAPTITNEGVRTYTCARCGDAKTEAIAKQEICDGGTNCLSKHFVDVAGPSDWTHKGIDYAVANGLFSGMSATRFEPETAMTRAMLVTVLWRYAGKPVEGTNGFSDVPNGEWYSEAVTWAAHNGVVAGVGNGKFDPEGKITREQMAAILYRYASKVGIDTSKRAELSFPDAGKTSSYAKEALQWAVAEGLVSGSKEGSVTYLHPQGNATRAQVASILMRFIENVAK